VIPSLLDELLRAAGPSGFEGPVAAIVRREAAAFAEASGDVHGSTTAVVHGTTGGGLLAIFAHCDEIGAMVSHVDDDGFLSLHRLANTSAGRLVGQRVEIQAGGGTVPGMVGDRRKADTRRKETKPTWADLYVDIGAGDREAALGLVALGDPLVIVGPPVELAGGRIASKACDNRVSIYVALQALRALAADPPAWDVAFVASVQEEGSYAGATTTAFRLAPDAALVLDVTHATDTPGASPRDDGHHPLGSGAAVLRGPVVHPVLFELALAQAVAGDIPHTVEVGLRSMTDADATYIAGAGVPSAVISTPLRRMHTAVETVELGDLEASVRLVEAFARGLEPGLDLRR
jgi:putative aminopeptidase FrvX